MKMKLAQRIAIRYYQAKFKILSVVSERKAAEAMFHLFCTPYSGKPKRKAPFIFAAAEVLHFTLHGLTVHGWRWKPKQPNGRRILIVHGFDSCSYRFDKYITPLNEMGFEVVAFDAPAHGISEGKTMNALGYSNFIIKIEELYGSFYCVMAHSLGGLATALAFQQFNNQEGRKLVLIAPNTETSSAVQNFFRFVPISKTLQTAFIKYLEEVGNRPMSAFSVKELVQHIKARVLWIHDEEDVICPYIDTIPVQEMRLPNVEFFITKGLGHSGIYRNENVFDKIMHFLEN
jgi:pimeloyl-ACP methyl ester carboxylesterase